eukprot:7462394-Pyramimonas_sp.AAC.1
MGVCWRSAGGLQEVSKGSAEGIGKKHGRQFSHQFLTDAVCPCRALGRGGWGAVVLGELGFDFEPQSHQPMVWTHVGNILGLSQWCTFGRSRRPRRG